MEILVRLLLRVLLVPLGILAAVVTATLVAAVANWTRFMALVLADPNATLGGFWAVVAGAALVVIMAVAVVAMLLPGLLAVLISEGFAIRSWIFHALSGGASIWVGWAAMGEFRRQYEFYDDPKIVVAAGIAAGFAYWAVAGWSAGFWKPVFRRPAAPVAAGTETPPAQTTR
jgi:hypothetical protein